MHSIIEAIQRYCRIGDSIVLTLAATSGTTQVHGKLREVFGEGVILENESQVSYFSAVQIIGFDLCKSDAANVAKLDADKTAPDLDHSDSGQGESASAIQTAKSDVSRPNSAGERDSVTNRDQESGRSVSAHLAEPATIYESVSSPSLDSDKIAEDPDTNRLLSGFSAHPQLELPEPSFDFQGLDSDEKQEANKIRNKYEYAIKIKEPERISEFLPALLRLADRTQHHALFLNTGLLNMKVGRIDEARRVFERSLHLGNPVAALALVKSDIEAENWLSAANTLAEALLHELDLGVSRLVLLNALGYCLRKSPKRQLPGIGLVATESWSEIERRILSEIVTAALSETHPEAAQKALRGDLGSAFHLSEDALVWHASSSEATPSSKRTEALISPPGDEEAPSWGHISAFYPERKFGFIISNSQRTFFFFVTEVQDSSLRDELSENMTGQEVSFTRRPKFAPDHKYDVAVAITWIKKEAPYSVERDRSNIPNAPKGDSIFARAKFAELSGELGKAEKLLRRTIEGRLEDYKSAVKDLAMLLNRKGRFEEAISVLDTYGYLCEDDRSVLNVKATLLVGQRDFTRAAEVYTMLVKNARGREQHKPQLRLAYCILMQGEIDKAIEIVRALAEQTPGDSQTMKFLERVERYKQGHTDDEGLLGLAGLSTMDSAFCDEMLANCDFTGVDERTKVRGFYTKTDIRNVKSAMDRIARGRRPKDKAKYLITLAAMSHRSPAVDEESNVHTYLARALAFMAEASTYERLDPDVIRFYIAESFRLGAGSQGFDHRFPLCFLLASYFDEVPQPGDFVTSREYDLAELLRRFCIARPRMDQFLRHLPHYAFIFRRATEYLISQLRQGAAPLSSEIPDLAELSAAIDSEQQRQQTERVVLDSLNNADYSTFTSFEQAGKALFELATQGIFDLDRRRLSEVARIAVDAASLIRENDFIEKESKLGRLNASIAALQSEITRLPTRISVEWLRALLTRMHDNVIEHFRKFVSQTKPVFELANVLSGDYYIVDNDSCISVRLQLLLQKGCAPIEGIDIIVPESPDLRTLEPAHSPELLRGGESREIELRLRLSEKLVLQKAFTLPVILQYRTRSGTQERSDLYSLSILVGEQTAFETIPNPYREYAGGRPIEDPVMFKGRRALLERITFLLTDGSMGQCFVLYGQKRSGKTSVLNQVRRQLLSPCLAVSVTLGSLDTSHGQTNFMEICLDELHDRVVGQTGSAVSPWPSSEEIRSEPTAAFKTGFRAALAHLKTSGWDNPRLILLIDEFTYIFEYIREGIVSPQFMRNWKALLQMQLFSAVVVGQDSMPKFKHDYPNEFGVTLDERISYFETAEAHSLADDPILLNGESRWRGNALGRLMQLTAGSPYYLNILLDRLVNHLNSRKAPFITEADVDFVVQQCIAGIEALDISVFDPLITAAGESVAEASRDEYLRILLGVAESRVGASLADLPQVKGLETLLADMRDREVLVMDLAKRYSIRVGLFTEWLRTNPVIMRKLADV